MLLLREPRTIAASVKKAAKENVDVEKITVFVALVVGVVEGINDFPVIVFDIHHLEKPLYT